jgi:hypothetical protein
MKMTRLEGFLIAGIMLIGNVVFHNYSRADEAKAAIPPGKQAAPVTADTVVVLKLKLGEVQALANGVGYLPFNTAAPILTELKEQVDAQTKSKDEPAKESKK